MTLTHRKIHVPAVTALLCCALIGACASAPPPRSHLDSAQDAIARANALKASDFAPVEFDIAVNQMRDAEERFAKHDYRNADSAAEQAQANAELSEAKTRAAKARNEVHAKNEENARLRHDLLGEQGGQR